MDFMPDLLQKLKICVYGIFVYNDYQKKLDIYGERKVLREDLKGHNCYRKVRGKIKLLEFSLILTESCETCSKERFLTLT